MGKLLLALTVGFGCLCFAGAGYVLFTGGQASPGYAAIPMLCCVVCAQAYRNRKGNK